jgi:hypothetical protein
MYMIIKTPLINIIIKINNLYHNQHHHINVYFLNIFNYFNLYIFLCNL